MSEEKFSKCGEGEKNASVEFRVFGKKRSGRKVPEEKNQSVFGWKFKVKDFAIVFTSWALHWFAN